LAERQRKWSARASRPCARMWTAAKSTPLGRLDRRSRPLEPLAILQGDAVPVPPSAERFPCPECLAAHAVLTGDRFGVKTYYCPDCEHSWDCDEASQPADDPDE